MVYPSQDNQEPKAPQDPKVCKSMTPLSVKLYHSLQIGIRIKLDSLSVMCLNVLLQDHKAVMDLQVNLDQAVKIQSQALVEILVVLDQMASKVGLNTKVELTSTEESHWIPCDVGLIFQVVLGTWGILVQILP